MGKPFDKLIKMEGKEEQSVPYTGEQGGHFVRCESTARTERVIVRQEERL